MNDEAALPGRNAYHSRSVNISAARVGMLIADVARAAAFNHDPAASSLWIHAPWHLRHQYADGRCDRETFWLRLRLWLEFQQRTAA